MKLHNLKEELEQRSLEVSENSWETLAAQLDANDQWNRRRKIRPYAIAASIIFCIGMTALLLRSNDQVVPKTSVVNTTINTENNSTKVEKITNQHTQKDTTQKLMTAPETTVAVAEKNTTHTKITKRTPKKNTPIQAAETLPTQKETQTLLAMEATQKDTLSRESKQLFPIPNQTDLKIAIADLSIEENIAISDAEIEQLLHEATETLQHLDVEKTIDLNQTISATELLDEVELELDRSFKQKVFDLIKRNVTRTKTAVIDP